ncbi:MAG: apolipoprotein N-acyltransferase [Pseudomonadota bacterium]
MPTSRSAAAAERDQDRRHQATATNRFAACLVALTGWRRLAAAAGAGILFAAGHAPIGLPWTAFLALPVLVILLGNAPSLHSAFVAGWAFGFGYLVVSLHWIGHAFLVDAASFAWMMPFALAGLPAFLALFWGTAGLAARWAAPGGGPPALVAFAAALTLTEFARSHVLTGFPWALPGYVWIDTGLAQLAAFTGPHALGLLTLLATGLPLLAVLTLRGRPRATFATLGLAAFAGLWLLGLERLDSDDALSATPPRPVLRLVQPNAPQHLKWHPEHAPTFYRRLLAGSAAPAEGALGAPDIVIWPETAVAFLLEESPIARSQMAAATGGAPLVLGALRRRGEGEGGGFANSLFTLDASGDVIARYDKHHLVPFGEYVPFQSLFSALGVEQLAQRGRFVPGPGQRVLSPIPGLPGFVPLICYEAIFPHEIMPPSVADGAPRPGWLLQITNDAWFGTLGGPQQHLAQARLRAIEQGLPLVRAANTGISAVIDAHGRIVASLPLGQHGHVDAHLPEALPPTLYARIGDGPALIAAFLLFSACFLRIVLTRSPRG